MSGQMLAPVPGGGGPFRPQRMIPPLPPGIPILPGSGVAPRKRGRLPWVIAALIAIFVLWRLGNFAIAYGEQDQKTIDGTIRGMMRWKPKKGDRYMVSLHSGFRQIELEFSTVDPPAAIGEGPTTCVSFKLFDPGTGAEDRSYPHAQVTCIKNMAYRFH